jgi:hypothetical protein
MEAGGFVTGETEYPAPRLAEAEGLDCVWRPFHDTATDMPFGPACGAEATHVIIWLDGTRRWSTACLRHLELEFGAPPCRIIPIPELKS